MTEKIILHLKIPLLDKAIEVNDWAISPEELGEFMKYIQEKLGEKYIVIASPCEPSLYRKNKRFYNFDMQQLTREDLDNVLLNKEEKNE